MPDISGFQALDVAIGLAFLYFVFSLLASGVNEAIAATSGLSRVSRPCWSLGPTPGAC